MQQQCALRQTMKGKTMKALKKKKARKKILSRKVRIECRVMRKQSGLFIENDSRRVSNIQCSSSSAFESFFSQQFSVLLYSMLGSPLKCFHSLEYFYHMKLFINPKYEREQHHFISRWQNRFAWICFGSCKAQIGVEVFFVLSLSIELNEKERKLRWVWEFKPTKCEYKKHQRNVRTMAKIKEMFCPLYCHRSTRAKRPNEQRVKNGSRAKERQEKLAQWENEIKINGKNSQSGQNETKEKQKKNWKNIIADEWKLLWTRKRIHFEFNLFPLLSCARFALYLWQNAISIFKIKLSRYLLR